MREVEKSLQYHEGNLKRLKNEKKQLKSKREAFKAKADQKKFKHNLQSERKPQRLLLMKRKEYQHSVVDQVGLKTAVAQSTSRVKGILQRECLPPSLKGKPAKL